MSDSERELEMAAVPEIGPYCMIKDGPETVAASSLGAADALEEVVGRSVILDVVADLMVCPAVVCDDVITSSQSKHGSGFVSLKNSSNPWFSMSAHEEPSAMIC